MTVWIVVEETPYEGEEVVGVYASKESADRRAEKESSKPHYSYFSVDEYEVQP